MLLDFWLSRRVWCFGDGVYVIAYGFLNMAFMLIYYIAAGCLTDPLCDLDGAGHPYVYHVVDWRKPVAATTVCLLAIFIPMPLISAALASLFRRRAQRMKSPVVSML